MKINLVFIVVALFSCTMNQSEYEIEIPTLAKEELIFQKQVVGQLTGYKSIPLTNARETRISSRWNLQEKQLTIAYLKKVLNAMGLKGIEQPYQHKNINPAVDLLVEPFNGTNLYTLLPATTNSKEYIVLGAHYDTGAKNVPGAIDNASGMALILSVLRRLKNSKQRTKNTIIVFFDQEEEKLVGSSAFVKFLKKEQLFVHSVHTYDMVGWDSDNNKEVELEMPNKYLEELYKKHASLLNIPIYTTQINSSDHYSFIKAGFTGVGISQAVAKRDNSGKKDTPADQYPLVNFEYLISTTSLAFEVIKDILNN